MKAIIWTDYGAPENLQLQEVEKPVPKADEILVRIHAATVTAGDCEMRRLQLPLFLSWPMRIYAGFQKPTRIRILGQEMAGQVEAVGAEVQQYQPGDRVFAMTGLGKGTYAEYVCLTGNQAAGEGVTALMPASLSYEEAACVPLGGLEALNYLRQAQIQPGQKVLVNGAGGSIGTIGVQLAKYYGGHITAVDSGEKLEMLRSIGADEVIDYRQEDFTRRGETYDVIFDVVGKSHYGRSLRLINKGGFYLLANPKLSTMFRGPWSSLVSGRKVVVGNASQSKEDLSYLGELVEAGVIKPVIDRRYPLERTAEAHRYVETGAKQGNVVITVV